MKNIIKLISITLICFYTQFAFAERARLALVIGNADYSAGKLRNPVNDARAISATLRELGFHVKELENASQEEMEQAVMQFGRSLNQNTVGLFYFSGHGVQHNGQNYLIPIGAMGKVNTADLLRYKTMNAGFVLDTMKQSGSGLNFFFLDACRNTPFKSFTKSLNRGLTRIDGAQGTLISFATAPGKVALDGKGKNSPYTLSLLKWMKTPNLPIELMLKKVRTDVKKRTKGKQLPWYEASIDGHFSFNSGGKDIVDNHTDEESSTDNSPTAHKKQGKRISHYIAYDDGTAFDKNTGLLWQRCSVGQEWNGRTCTGNAKTYSWSNAMKLGSNGWRLPTADELGTIIYCSSGKTKGVDENRYPNGCAGDYRSPTINTKVFPIMGYLLHTSSSQSMTSPNYAWTVAFSDGEASSYHKYNDYYARLVRGGQ